MDILGEHLGHKENHHARPFAHKNENRRKLAKIVGAATLATAVAVGTVEGLALAGKFTRGEIPTKEPNAFMNGKVEIVMSDNLNVRTSPQVNGVENDNTVDWSKIEQIQSKGGKWIDVKDGKALFIEMPAVYKTDEEKQQDSWLTFDAKVSGLLGSEEQRLYINFDPNKTGNYVKRVESGSIYDLGGNSGSDWDGTVTVEK